jgi:predicted ArsR family transcriptional regulator
MVPSDIAILDLLRQREELSVADFVEALGVTATAVRQRLNRLRGQGFIDRVPVRAGRGRPSHNYAITKAGRRQTGANFADLAIALWEEIRDVKDDEVRRGLMQRVARRMAGMYADQIRGRTVEERMQSLAELFSECQIPFAVEADGDLPILTAQACPYPDLAEQDRGICSMERLMLSEIVGAPLRLSRCRLDGETCCTFEPRELGTG